MSNYLITIHRLILIPFQFAHVVIIEKFHAIVLKSSKRLHLLMLHTSYRNHKLHRISVKLNLPGMN